MYSNDNNGNRQQFHPSNNRYANNGQVTTNLKNNYFNRNSNHNRKSQQQIANNRYMSNPNYSPKNIMKNTNQPLTKADTNTRHSSNTRNRHNINRNPTITDSTQRVDQLLIQNANSPASVYSHNASPQQRPSREDILNNARRIRNIANTLPNTNSIATKDDLLRRDPRQRSDDSFEDDYWEAYVNHHKFISLMSHNNQMNTAKPVPIQKPSTSWTYRGPNGKC